MASILDLTQTDWHTVIMRTIKLVFLIIFAIVCLMGIFNIASRYIFPDQNAGTSLSTLDPQKVAWSTYSSSAHGYAVDYPSLLVVTEAEHTTSFQVARSPLTGPAFPAFYISVIPDGLTDDKRVYHYMSKTIIDKFFKMQNGESMQTIEGDEAIYWTFIKLGNLSVSGYDAVMIRNENVLHGNGLANRRVLVRKPGFTYIIGSYYDTQKEIDFFQRFVLNLRFTN